MRARTRLAGAAVVVAAAVAGSLAGPAAAADTGRHEATQKALDGAVRDGVPGVTAHAVDKDGAWRGTSGVGDLRTKTPRGAHDRFRVGSITKSFVATVLLQLQGEGKIDLDDPVGKWLPGVVQGHGHDGDKITVRQLLNHTSGVYDYTDDPDFTAKVFETKGFLKHRYDTWAPGQQVKLAMRHKPYFAPGQGWKYSNTNYLLAGMVIKKVTGHDYGDEIERRVIKPLGLRATSVPSTDSTVPQPSSRAYSKLSEGAQGRTYDVTELNPTIAGPAGGMISDAADLNRFYAALLGGRLLPKEQLAEMKTTVPMGEDSPNASYGLGLMKNKLPCDGGAPVWGHGGGIHGSTSQAVTTGDGRHSLAFNYNGDWTDEDSVDAIVTAEYCGK
ncbi:serine hydrolase domain-containing protein [Streptomyces sp. NPDC059009]|uniref:serine hydrolase domain-containing protein n=1 Tax=Streptomyces sp. NPDC059009 TaxID=3346694 RepID=UPI0036C13E7A